VPAGQAVLEALARAQGGFAFQFSSFAGAATGSRSRHIMGQGLANPVGTFWSCVLLLEHIGELEQPGS
jgi:isocitrate dehydrogenase